MPESRVLVLDADRRRAEQLGALLDFVDCTPVLARDAGEIPMAEVKPDAWLAVIVGEADDRTTLVRFATWLARVPSTRRCWRCAAKNAAGCKKPDCPPTMSGRWIRR